MNVARLQDTKSEYKSQLYFYTLALEQSENENKNFIYGSIKNKILMNTFNKY